VGIEEKTKIYVELSNFIEWVTSARMNYTSPTLYTHTGSYDYILLSQTGTNSKGVLIGVINNDTTSPYYLRLDPKWNRAVYENKILGIQPLTVQEVNSIKTSSGVSAYGILFYEGQKYENLYPQYFYVLPYNSGAIINVDLSVFDWYYMSERWKSILSVPGNQLEYNLNF
jgi:hypothetical protein